MTITWIGAHSNNYEKGRQGNTIKKIVVHWIVGTLEAADAVFKNGAKQVSAHYGIGDKEVHQYIKDDDIAYHAGNITVNRQSIGIEHEGGPELPISEETYRTSSLLIADLCRKYAIPADRTHIIGHREVKATACPGTLDIDRLVGMIGAILAPSDALSELDKIRQARDSHWNDLMKIKDALNVTGDYSITTIVSRADQLNGFEVEVGKKDQEITKLKEEATSIQSQLNQALQVNTEAQNLLGEHKQMIDGLKSENEDMKQRLENSAKIIVGLGERIEELKQSKPVEAYSGLSLIFLGIGRLLRRG